MVYGYKVEIQEIHNTKEASRALVWCKAFEDKTGEVDPKAQEKVAEIVSL